MRLIGCNGVVKVRDAQPTVLSCCGFDGFLGCFCLFVFDYRDLGIAPTAACAAFDRRVLA